MEKSARRTGTTRLVPQMKGVRGLLEGDDLEGAVDGHGVVGLEGSDSGIDKHFKLGELRVDAVMDSGFVLAGELELIGGVELGLELDGFDGGAAEEEGVDANAVSAAGEGLDLEGASERVGLY